MAEEEEVEESGGGKKKLILIIVGALLLIGAAVGGTLMFVGGDDTEAAAVAEEAVVEKGKAIYVDLKPAFTVNLDPQDPVGFLQISIQILTYNDDVAAQIEKHKPLIRNNLMALFGQQKSIDLRAPEGKEALQKSTLQLVQDVIDKQGGGGEVDSVFFTNFVMQ
ncbi:MAG: flagellar basal body-associated FliL family protein [Gammaproteobacteria bacterium]|nr:flagellar basal body-associated FliL family protein [Gammaproteobacteria bacterium]